MTFVHSLATAFRSGASRPAVDQKSDQQTMEHPEPHTITHRARQARWLKSNEDEKSHQDETTLSGGLRTAKELFRLAYDISREESAESAAQLALDRLLTNAGKRPRPTWSCSRRTNAKAKLTIALAIF
jgi:hypothetical protein